MPTPAPTLQLDTVVQLRKPHACGGDQWRVVRLGADIGLRCLTCERRILLPRAELTRQLRRVVVPASHPAVAPDSPTP